MRRKTSDGRASRYDIAIVGGAGHVGLPLAVTFAGRGRRVLIHDVDARALALIRRGAMPFEDRGALPLLRAALRKGMLGFSSEHSCVRGVPVVIVTIGTPVDEFMNPEVEDVVRCFDELLPHLSEDQLLILRSTISPGVTDWLERRMRARGRAPRLAFCPERVVQGRALEELHELPQIVSGTTPEAEAAAAEVFALCAPEILRLSPKEAEFAKLFTNAYRYIHFAISNQFFTLAASAGLDYHRILGAMRRGYPRLKDMPTPGLTAGPCLFKDTMQLVAASANRFNLGQAAMAVNEGLPNFLVEMLARDYDLPRLSVGLLGMAFKADSDDIRASLSYKLKKLLRLRAKAVWTTDPLVRNDRELKPLERVLEVSDLLILCVPHSEYRGLDSGGKPVVDPWQFLGRAHDGARHRARGCAPSARRRPAA